MLTARMLLPVVVAASVLWACRSATDEQSKAEHEQREAHQAAVAAAAEAQRKLEDVKQRAAQETDAIVKDAAEKMNEANAEARETVAEVQAELVKSREETRTAVTKTLEAREKDVAELRGRLEKKLPKPEAEKVVRDLQDKSSAVRESLRELDSATGLTLDAVKRTVEQRVQDLERAIEEARKRV